jgi:hypothetical protein
VTLLSTVVVSAADEIPCSPVFTVDGAITFLGTKANYCGIVNQSCAFPTQFAFSDFPVDFTCTVVPVPAATLA